MEDGCPAVTVVSIEYNCTHMKPENASVRFCLRAVTILLIVSGSKTANEIHWVSKTFSDKASNKTLALPSFLSSPNSLYRLVQKFQLLIPNSIQSASWTLLPTSWRNLSCYIGETRDLGTAAVATSVGKKRNSEKRSSCGKQPLCLHLLAKMTEVGWSTRFNSCLIFPA